MFQRILTAAAVAVGALLIERALVTSFEFYQRIKPGPRLG